MKERAFVIIKCLVMLLIAMALFCIVKIETYSINTNRTSRLVVYGDNVDKSYAPFIENDSIYISFDTVQDFIDSDVFFDTSSNKVIITNDDFVYKLSENSISKNLQPITSNNVIKFIDEEPYIDVSILKDIYNLKCEYEEETDTVSIDNKTNSDLKLNYNEVRLYSDIRTDSDIIEVLNTDNTVVVYTESLNHSRWYKVKSDSGKIGYIEKAAVTIKDEVESEENTPNVEENVEKKIMFWQYGSKLDTLGDKIDGVDVAMPTWFKLASSDGSVEINYDRDYYQKAKQNGYELYPIISNNYDSTEIDSKELTSDTLKNEQSRENLLRNILNIVEDYDLEGINVDFENMNEVDKDYYTQFLKELHPLLREKGKILSVDVYFTNYIDRTAVGKVVDYFMLMGYDQRGNWSQNPGSISELPWVEKNVKSLIEDSNIDPQKIILGIPFYTRLWEIDSDGELSSQTLSLGQCQRTLESYNLSTTYDEQSGQNYVSYLDGGSTYKLWVEDADSVSARTELVNKYNLGGVTAWQKGLATDEIWEVIKNVIN